MKESLLYRILHNSSQIDKYIVVGGYRYPEMERFIKRDFPEYASKLILVENTKYAEYGSGYSLYKGLEKAMDCDFDEIIFAEGDLYVDNGTYQKIITSEQDVISINTDPILADRAVALYLDSKKHVHYIYDVQHGVLEIEQPFIGIFHSGQIWKFARASRIREKFIELTAEEWRGTNLTFIQKYFEDAMPQDYQIIKFDHWINCNTIDDFRKIHELEAEQ